MHNKYPHVFSPVKLGPVEITNRFYFAPHGTALAVGSKPSQDFAHYKAARVRNGGCGLVIASTVVHERGRIYQPSPFPEENIPDFQAMADEVHAAGGKIFAQLWYWWGCTGSWQPLSPPAPSLSASTVQHAWNDRTISTHQMTRQDIRSVIDAYRQSSANLRRAGFDGIELHAAHGAIIEHFISPYFNHRTDEYGGGLENRLRFLFEVLEATREGAGDKLAVGMRFNCDEMLPGGYGQDQAQEVLRRVAGPGLIDFVDLDVAVEPMQSGIGFPPVFVAPQVYRPYVEAMREAVGAVPILSVLGRVTSVADAEEAIAAGVCDMVGAARALIAEPELVSNAYAGKEARSRTCVACNWCCGAMSDGAQGCTINPAAYRERLWGPESFRPAARKSKVVVVGGGPAGLEAARVSALKGHEVVLLEAREALGGGLALWASLPSRGVLGRAVEWWEREVRRLGVTVCLGTGATAQSVLQYAPDAVIIATGSLYSRAGHSAFRDADIPGHDRDLVYRPEDILLRGDRPDGKVLLLDGEGAHASLGIAELLADRGAEVEILTASVSLVSVRLLESLEAEFVMQRLRAAGVRFSPGTWLQSIGDGEVLAYDVFTGEERRISDVDAVVLATGRVPQEQLAVELEGRVAQLFAIGDALGARPWATAAYEGQKFARYIGEPDAPNTVSEAYFSAILPEEIPLPASTLLS
ncbi:FAD-dependent oxidoreductase [Haliea sp. E17]|uniref:oxidoreductase n=1 Tax=Haliea sp. E17 TaxID=3401576 RepID=UPI003AB0F6AE